MPITARQIHNQNPLSALTAHLQRDLEKMDQIIDHHLTSDVPLIPTIGRHLISAGGKRLRPLLTIASYRLFEATKTDVLGLAAAVEFIHTATLLHDDVVDDSKLRRGIPSANELWGNSSSVLVGDFLFARAFQLMVEARHPEVLDILASTAARIAEGEVLQLSLCHQLDVKVESLLQIIEAKTAALFAAATHVGPLMAQNSKDALALRAYGYNLGMTFQIVDDILDYTASTPQLGKEVGDDFREGKVTLPLILAYGHCDREEKVFFQRALIDPDQNPADFDKAFQILQNRDGFTQAYALAKEYSAKALQALSPLADHPIKEVLADLVDHCLQRTC